MSEQVSEVKAKTDIVSVIGERVELKKAGSNLKGLCPFHNEKTPSFMVSPELQIFKCFGCGKSGDVFTFLEEYEGMEFYDALKYLADKSGIKLKPLRGEKKGLKEKLVEVNSLVARFYQYVLIKHPAGKRALTYLTKERGLTLDTVRKFQLGYSPDLQLALKNYIIDRKKISLSELEQAGVVYLREGRGVDRFRGRVIFPLFDHNSNTIGFAGRILPSKSTYDLAKYINSPETPVYHKSKVLYGLNETRKEIKKLKEAIIVEGELDLISSWQAGIKNIVAIKGSALTEEQIKLLSRFAKSVVFALDTDFAGNEAAKRGIVIAEKEGLEVKVARLGKYKDPDEAARDNPEGLKNMLNNAEGIWDFIIDSVIRKYQGKTGEQKSKISKELVPILGLIEDKIVQAHYIGLVAKQLNVPVEAVSGQVENSMPGKHIELREAPEEVKNKDKSRREILEERLLAIIFRLDPKDLEKEEIDKILETPLAKKISLEFLKFTKAKKYDLKVFAGQLPEELAPGFTDLVLKEIEGLQDADGERLKKEFLLLKGELRKLKLKEDRDLVTGEIQRFETDKNRPDLMEAEKKYTSLTRKLSELEGKN